MSINNATVCPLCQSKLVFRKTTPTAVLYTGFCETCYGYPFKCLNCGALTTVDGGPSICCPRCGNDDANTGTMAYKNL